MTNAVFMPYVLAFNDKAIADRMARLAMWLGLKTHSTAGVIDWVLRLREDVGVPHTLAGLKVDGDADRRDRRGGRSRSDRGRQSGQVRSRGGQTGFRGGARRQALIRPAVGRRRWRDRIPSHLAATLPCWGARVSPVPLAGGLTNDNFIVEDGGKRYVVRVGGDIPAHNIVRTTEAAASRAAHAAGVSPRVRYAEPDALVIDFVDGRTLTPEDVRAPENLARLVELIRRAHREIPKHFPGPAPLFWVFQVVRDYARVLARAAQPACLHARRPSREGGAAGTGGRADRHRLRPQRSSRRQSHRRRQAALAGRLGICRLQLAAVRPRRPRLEQRDRREAARAPARSSISTGRSTAICAVASPR